MTADSLDLSEAQRAELAEQLDGLLDTDLFRGRHAVDPEDFEWERTHLEIVVHDVVLPTAGTSDNIPEFTSSLEMAVERAVLNALTDIPLFDRGISVGAAYWRREKESYSSHR